MAEMTRLQTLSNVAAMLQDIVNSGDHYPEESKHLWTALKEVYKCINITSGEWGK